MKKQFTLIVLLLNWAILSYADPCTNILPLACGVQTTFTSIAAGDINWPNNIGNCGGSSSQGGQEQIYKFKAPISGTYQLTVNSDGNSTDAMNYLMKDSASGCGPGGWSCITRTSSTGPKAAFPLTAGQVIYIMLNSEDATLAHAFTLSCGFTSPCDYILPLPCGVQTTFTSDHFGDPAYPNNIGNCGGNSLQGGEEQIYKFKAPISGTYQLTVNSDGNSTDVMNYLMKDSASGCGPGGWSCITRTSSTGPKAAFPLTAGLVIYIMLNSEDATLAHAFTLSCGFTSPCDYILPLPCGVQTTFTSDHFGDPAYPNNIGNCGGNSLQGGEEQIYKFKAPISGTYQLTVNSDGNSTDVMNYLMKDSASGCGPGGWSCITRTSSTGPKAAFPLTAGQVIYLMLNSEDATLAHAFTLSCGFTSPCDYILPLPCGVQTTFTSDHFGDPAYPNNIGNCGGNSLQGGEEQIYKFKAPISGTYQLTVNSDGNSTDVMNYLMKDSASGCGPGGWSCITRTSSTGPKAAFPLTAGQVIYIMLNSEDATLAHAFTLSCGFTSPCDYILPLPCGVQTTFTSDHFGDPAYPNNIGNCGGNSLQGGEEQIYKFKAPISGTYQLTVNSDGNSTDVMNYLMKDSASGCGPGGWSCITRTSSTGPKAAFPLTAGLVIYLMLNSEDATLAHAFTLSCGFTSPCDYILPLPCGVQTTFTSDHFGDPAYPNNIGNCGGNSLQGGEEQIYKFKAPISGTYQLTVNSDGNSSDVMNYLMKDSSSGCGPEGWSCISRTSSTGPKTAFNLSAGDVIYILLNSESTGLTHTFTLSCGYSVCNDIDIINCGAAKTFIPSAGFGNADYPNGFNGCTGSGQGGPEKVYKLPPSSTNYQVSITSATGGNVEYLWKYDSLCCGTTGWNCMGVKSGPFTFPVINSSPGATVLLMLNAESTGTVSHTFQVTCSPLIISTMPCNIDGSNNVCIGDSVKLKVDGGYLAAGATWKWYKNSCGGNFVGSGPSITVSPIGTTTYFVRAEGPNTTLCLQKTVTVNPLPTATITKNGPLTFCKDENPLTLTANAGAGLNYQWQKGNNDLEGATDITYIPTKSGTYKVTVMDQNGCSKQSDGKIVAVNDLPTATITPLGPTTFCEGDSVMLQANIGSGLTYQWKKDGNNISGATNNTYTAKEEAKYKVKVNESVNGCSKTSKNVKVKVNCKLISSSTSDLTILTLFPNPTITELNVVFKNAIYGEAEMRIQNALGQVVLKAQIMIEGGTYAEAINITALAQGVYFVEINLPSGEKAVSKFIKQ